MLTLKKIAVTGSVASGKSTVCRLLEELKCYIINADEIVHELLVPESDIGKKIIHLLGREVVAYDGKFDKQQIADRVFGNQTLLFQLEELIHPEVQRVIEKKYLELSQTKNKYPLFVAEVPLLFESKLESFYDAVIVVTATGENCRTRFSSKRGFSLGEWQRREERLIPISEKIKRTHFVINNNGTLKELKKQVRELFNQITSN